MNRALVLLFLLLLMPLTGCAYQVGYAAGTVTRTVANTLP
jgi:hypothetical protein